LIDNIFWIAFIYCRKLETAMNLRDLKYLIALADHKHFGKAADASFVSQPTLSTQLKKLENTLDVQLFERANKQVMLTPIGERVCERARVIVAEAAAIKELARASRAPDSGRITLGIFPTLAPYLLPHVVANIRQKFPHLELFLIEDKTKVLLEKLERGELDAAIIATPIADDSLAHQVLFEEPFVFAAPRGNAMFKSRKLKLSDLHDQRLLLLEDGHCMRQHALDVCHLAGAQEDQEFRATSLETLRQMVAAGVGMTLLPILAVKPPVAANSLISWMPFADPPPTRTLALFWRKSSPRGAFLEKLAPVLGNISSELLSAQLREGMAEN
jgi:LysR family transcriptional regulator, hydrogen peroxide-inducible genes activator